MNFVFENFETINNSEADTYAEAVRRALALVDNIADVENYKGEVGKIKIDMIDKITVYGNDYADEFYIDFNEKVNPEHPAWETAIYLEILTSESAEENEIEYMNGNTAFTNDERCNYKLGETVQWYKPLGKSGYWYCLK